MRAASDVPHVLMIGNNAAPTDRRLWLECLALRDAGMAVSVVCPERGRAPSRERLDGIDVYRYRQGRRGGRRANFLSSYAVAWLQTMRLTWTVWRRHRFDVIQACNPPDTYFTIAWAFRMFGVRFVFDQHDLSPEIYRDRFAGASPKVHALLLWLERLSHRSADQVTTVNGSCRELLLARTSTPPDRLTVIRTGPDLARLRRVGADPDLRQGRRFLCAYLGVMGPQDCVELILHAVRNLVHHRGRQDVQFVFMGDGECLGDLVELSRTLQVEPWVRFTGWADDRTISSVLSTADLGLQPDRRTPFTELCSMLKTIEYLAFGLPVVAFDLTETRRTAQQAAAYVPDETPAAFADTVAALLDDPARRRSMSEQALRRAHSDLAWERQKDTYVDVVRRVVPTAVPTAPPTPIRTSTTDRVRRPA